MADIHKTSMGKKFYEKDIPAIMLQLKRIADALEKENTLTEKRLKMEHVSFVKEQRSTRAGTDYRTYKTGKDGQATTIED
tara:strand:- start:1169 stop:1408 length:240 start_codon:yes stop_codon:yes gene_type:complete